MLLLGSFLGSHNSLNAQVNLGQDIGELDYSHPKKYEIGGIKVDGIEYLDEKALIMISGLQVGNTISVPGDDISQSLKKLWKQGLFENIAITVEKTINDRIFLVIHLQERARLTGFSINGIKKGDVDNIREKIQLVSGDVVTENLMIRTKQKIHKYFNEKGFLNAEVVVEKKPDPKKPNGVVLNIDIKKHGKVRIGHINIIGNEDINTDKLKSSMKETKEVGYFKPFDNIEKLLWDITKDVFTLRIPKIQDDAVDYYNENVKLRIFKSSKYIEKNYIDDKANLIAKYNKMGYRDAKILEDSIYKSDKNKIDIDIIVDEGNKYYFRNINWVGNTVYSDIDLSNVLQIDKGDVYNNELLSTNLQFNQNGPDVSSLYLDNGYLFFSVDPVEVNVINDSIDLEIRIREGEQARLKNVRVMGNTRTNDHVIIRELRTRPGQLFSRAAVIRTQRELAQLKYFDPEKLGVDVKPNPLDGTVDIEYTVEETSSDQIELSGGWGYGQVIGTLGLSFNNFSLRNVFKKDAWRPIPSGDGQKLSLRFQTYGAGYMSYSVSFTEPWLGGKKPNAFSVSYSHSLYSNGLQRDDPRRATFVIDGFTVGLGKRLTWPDDFFQLYQGLKFQRYKLDNYSDIFNVGDGNGNFHNISYTIALSRNSLDAPIYPRNGSDVGISLEVTPPYSAFNNKDYSKMDENEKYEWVEYHKWKIRANWYSSVVGDLVLSTRVKFGFLGHYNSDIGNTPFERFYLGGDGLSGYNNMDGRELISLRGYGNETLTPGYHNNTNLGGTIYDKFTLELRYPVSLNPSATIYFMGFLEAGNSWLTFDDFKPFQVYKSAGFGVRVFLPMFGLLGLDWGYGFDDVPGLPNANGGQFHFSINQSID
ncbi:MAG: outer membrane protein assembly factor BamA [Bacteroidetes bacterium 4572_77]|nr:MAG: outer membrane protein assembly factor BamA [Bacteroidetes bacterium 4572_77]